MLIQKVPQTEKIDEVTEAKGLLSELSDRIRAVSLSVISPTERSYLLLLEKTVQKAEGWVDTVSGQLLAHKHSWQGGETARRILAEVPRGEGGANNEDTLLYLSDKKSELLSHLYDSDLNKPSEIDRQIDKIGLSLAKLLLRKIHREREGERLLQTIVTRHSSHIECMREAQDWAKSQGGSKEEQVKNAFFYVMEDKLSKNGTLPTLLLVHDIDNNLTPDDEHYALFPHKELYFEVQRLHYHLSLIPSDVRFAVLSLFGAAHPELRTHWYSQLRVMGQKVKDCMFEDAQELFAAQRSYTGRGGIKSYFVTGNNAIVGAQLADSLGVPQARIWGIEEEAVDGFDKHIAVLEIIESSPNAIVVFSDDGDSQLVQSIRRNSVLPKHPSLALQDLCFFAARQTTPSETGSFPLALVLEEQGIPFLSNTRITLPNSEAHQEAGRGYQGMSQFFSWYKAFTDK